MIRSSWSRLLCGIVALTCSFQLQAEEEEKSGQVLFYRMLGASSNAPLTRRTRTVCCIDGEVKTSTTGMARSGFTEYPFRKRRISYTFAENYQYFPRLVSGALVDSDRVNTGDVLIDHVYEPDPIVWGLSGREFCQTFVATGRELVSMTLLVASDPGRFRAALHEEGPGGRQIGDVHEFRSGHSMEWGWCRWKAAEAPLITGRSYAIRIWRVDGDIWQPYIHSTGDAYAAGHLYVDGRPVPGSDLGSWIVEEPPELTRAVVEEVDISGWVYGQTGVVFVPRSANIRLVDVTLSPALEKCRDVVARVWSTTSPPVLLAGPKKNIACTSPGTVRRAQFLFAAGELMVKPGERYRLEVFTIPHKGDITAPEETAEVPHDLRAWLYGEPVPDALPAIYNLRWEFQGKGDFHAHWSTTSPCKVTVQLRRKSPGSERIVVMEPGTTDLIVPGLWPGHDYSLRLQAHGPTGLQWRTPLYRFRVPHGPHGPPPPYPYPEHPDVLPWIASPLSMAPAREELIRYEKRVPLINGDFEEELRGWTTSPAGIVTCRPEEHGIAPANGKKMAGWSMLAGERREQVFEKSALYQKVVTTPGHEYLLSARVHTSVAGNFPRGDTRVRLCADPEGGVDLDGSNCTQWFWTDQRWHRFEHRFRAERESVTVGVGFFRWRDLDRASAYVDQIRLYDLGAARKASDEGIFLDGLHPVPRLTLTDSRGDATGRSEAYVEAPPGHVITGIGARAAGDNITTMRIRVQPLRRDGTLGPPNELLAGWELDAGLEASVDLPAGYVATGFGARIAPEWDVKTLAVWGRPLSSDGTLGEEKEFRAGVEPQGGLEKRVRLEEGRVLTSAGLRCSLNDVADIRATSARLQLTATGAAGPPQKR